MLLGIPNIEICTDCSSLIEESVFLSGNNFGADFYTDGGKKLTTVYKDGLIVK